MANLTKINEVLRQSKTKAKPTEINLTTAVPEINVTLDTQGMAQALEMSQRTQLEAYLAAMRELVGKDVQVSVNTPPIDVRGFAQAFAMSRQPQSYVSIIKYGKRGQIEKVMTKPVSDDEEFE